MTQSNKKEEKEKQREAQKVEPASEKKSGGKTAEKLKFYGVVAFLSLLCAGFIWFIFKPDTSETTEGAAGINTTIPDAIAPETMADKQKAYRTGTDEEAQAGKDKDLAGRGGRLPDAGHAGRAEAGKGGTGTGRYPGVMAAATTNLTTNHLVLSGTERQSQGKRSGTTGEGAE